MYQSLGRFGLIVIFLLGIVLPVSAPARVPRKVSESEFEADIAVFYDFIFCSSVGEWAGIRAMKFLKVRPY